MLKWFNNSYVSTIRHFETGKRLGSLKLWSKEKKLKMDVPQKIGEVYFTDQSVSTCHIRIRENTFYKFNLDILGSCHYKCFENFFDAVLIKN